MFVLVAIAALLLVTAIPAFAEGYNDPLQYTRDTGYFTGPHGGYTTTTNKCADCHSTHYAAGSYMLLRANSREAACDYCHGGGGGSEVSIMMDNDYRAGTYDMAQASAVETTTAGYGTGHTLGYEGNAPTDIDPAFSESQGFACFNCHTPHGNSARVLEAFGSPSHPAGDGFVETIYGVSFMDAQMFRMQESMKIDLGTGQGAPAGAGLYPADGDLSKLPTAQKYTGAAVEIGTGVSTNLGGELAATGAAFNAWLANMVFAPTAQDIGAWAQTPGNIGPDTNGDGYNEVTLAGMGNLMGLFMGGTSEPGSASGSELVDLFSAWYVYWGTDVDQGNIATCFMNMGDWQVGGYDFTMNPAAGNYGIIDMPELEVWHKPLFGKGRFLLLKNPDSGDDTAYSFDPMTGSGTGTNEMGIPAPDSAALFGAPAAPAGKKTAIDWEWPIGPAASWGPFFSLDSNERFPLAFPWAPKGVAMENEFCTSCHDGAAGTSTEAASVWSPMDNDYITAYSHDSNARGCARAQWLNPEDDNNFGPHCANCHTGASACQTCHSEDGENWESYGRPAYSSVIASSTLEGVSTYLAPGSVRTSAVADIAGQCLDGGFSYPHRTLGANMLKDAIYGVDFDGTPIDVGGTRGVNGADNPLLLADADIAADLGSFFTGGNSFDADTLVGASANDVENLDSVCIDCHGDATYWTGDTYKVTFTSANPLNPSQTWTVEGWNLLLKGLP